MFGCSPFGDDCIIRVVDTKDMISIVGSPYHSSIAALDALLFVMDISPNRVGYLLRRASLSDNSYNRTLFYADFTDSPTHW